MNRRFTLESLTGHCVVWGGGETGICIIVLGAASDVKRAPDTPYPG